VEIEIQPVNSSKGYFSKVFTDSFQLDHVEMPTRG
jgi:hypothetical protein